MSKSQITICVLGFGDHRALLHRCLESIYAQLPDPQVAEIRVGLNQPRGDLLLYAEQRLFRAGTEVPARLLVDSENPAKYPMMRRLFYEAPLETRYVMWFDDDSYLRSGLDLPADMSWFGVCIDQFIGMGWMSAPYSKELEPGQVEWIQAQPWYTGEPVDSPYYRVHFPGGAWWCGETSLLHYYDYPWPELWHNGGDVMWGELLRQQDVSWRRWSQGVAINADLTGHNASAPRRGLDTFPIGTPEHRRSRKPG